MQTFLSKLLLTSVVFWFQALPAEGSKSKRIEDKRYEEMKWRAYWRNLPAEVYWRYRLQSPFPIVPKGRRR